MRKCMESTEFIAWHMVFTNICDLPLPVTTGQASCLLQEALGWARLNQEDQRGLQGSWAEPIAQELKLRCSKGCGGRRKPGTHGHE